MNYIQQGIKVGDKVWTIQDGDTEVISIDLADPHPIMVGRNLCYKADGRHFVDDKNPSLFWSKPYQEMPKKPVKKYQWIWRKKGERFWDMSSCSWSTKEDFTKALGCVRPEDYDIIRFDPKEAL